MKILNTIQLVSERMKFKPVTNAEMEQMKNSMLNGTKAVNLIKPGDNLEAGDFVLVVCKGLNNDFFNARYGVYLTSVRGFITYYDKSGLDYPSIRNNFEYIFDNMKLNTKYAHYIVEIFRHENGKQKLKLTNDHYENIRETLINSTAYECVYRNAELMEKFNMI